MVCPSHATTDTNHQVQTRDDLSVYLNQYWDADESAMDAHSVCTPIDTEQFETWKKRHDDALGLVSPPSVCLAKFPVLAHFRPIFMDWLLELCADFRLVRTTYYRAVSILDRFFTVISVSQIALCEIKGYPFPKRKPFNEVLQSFATAAMYMSVQSDEVPKFTVNDFASITDGAYTAVEIRETGLWMMDLIGWRLNVPNPYEALEWAVKLHQESWIGKHLSSTSPSPSTLPALLSRLQRVSSKRAFEQQMHLLDMASLFVQSMEYSSMDLAMAALYVWSTQQPARDFESVDDKLRFERECFILFDSQSMPLKPCIAFLSALSTVLPSNLKAYRTPNPTPEYLSASDTYLCQPHTTGLLEAVQTHFPDGLCENVLTEEKEEASPSTPAATSKRKRKSAETGKEGDDGGGEGATNSPKEQKRAKVNTTSLTPPLGKMHVIAVS